MKTIKTSDERWRCFLEREEYRMMDELADELYGEEEPWVKHGIRIMALSVRFGTLTRIRGGAFHEGERGIMLLRVREKNSRGDDDKRRPRDIWVPRPLYNEFGQYMEENNIGEDDRLFPASESTFRRRFNSLCEELAERTDDEDWSKVTPHDLRRYYAIHFMFRLRVDPALVRQMGGWLSEASMLEYLILPDDVLVDELQDRGALGTDALVHHDEASDAEGLMESLASLLYRLDPDARAEALRCVEESLSSLEGVSASISIDMDDLDDMDDPSTPPQRKIRMYSGLPSDAIAEELADQARAAGLDYGLDRSLEKLEALCTHPDYVDPKAPMGAAKLSVGVLSMVAFAALFTSVTPTTAAQSAMLGLTGIGLGTLQINRDLREVETSPV
ncbi:hypothetical protein ACYJ1Y_16090 [Natrialbaceae archaeon A-gly3]